MKFQKKPDQVASAFGAFCDVLSNPRMIPVPEENNGIITMEMKPSYQLRVANALWAQV